MRAHAGQYDKRVTVWENVPSTNDDGQQVETPVEFITRWASVKPLTGRERFLAQQTQADTTHRVRVRSDGQTRTITPAMWITLRDGLK
jgi:SPP1 family predicted phage head-tail adaptor